MRLFRQFDEGDPLYIVDEADAADDPLAYMLPEDDERALVDNDVIVLVILCSICYSSLKIQFPFFHHMHII